MIGTSISLEDFEHILYPSITVCTDFPGRPTSNRTPNVTELLYYVRTQGPNGFQTSNQAELMNRYVKTEENRPFRIHVLLHAIIN